MTVYEATILKIQRLPEPLVQEVNDFVDFLMSKNERLAIAESDITDYLNNLEDYENRLAKGEIVW